MGLVHRNVVTRQPSSCDIPSTALGRKSILPFAIPDHKPRCLFFFFTLLSDVLNARLGTVTHDRDSSAEKICRLSQAVSNQASVGPDVATEKVLSLH